MARETTDTEVREGGRLSRALLALFWIGAGVYHFANPRFYERMVPPPLQDNAKLVVQVSGVAEIAGGAAVLVPGIRRLSGVYLIGLLAAVFPANIYMAREPDRFKHAAQQWAAPR